ncbi:hypothetical protein [uncultured Helicobacter sp.]|uniref:hypothetical protein n=1 Tax=uncultured Helicobacter sp. TaxID=175537 RepID=UPI00374E87F1
MKKAIIWGAGQVGIQAMWHMSVDYEIVGFVDSDPRKQRSGGGQLQAYKIQ